MRVSFVVALPVSALFVAACGSDLTVDDSASEPVASVASAVINGQLDTTRQAVVAIVSQSGNESGLCSGTIVKVDAARKIGWVLTAAHCVEVPPVAILQGNDFMKADLQYEVIDYKAAPQYTGQTGSTHDFAVIRIAGVDAATPTIPIVSSPDNLSTGTTVVSVGYGRTTLIASGNNDDNTVRRRVSMSIHQLNTAQIRYDMRNRGICQGDSGGPVLVGSASAEKVVGIHSFVEGDCNGYGYSGRVTYGLSFINGELNKALPKEDCGLCQKVEGSGNGACAALFGTCLADTACAALYECVTSGKSYLSCTAKFPKGQGPFEAAANCRCTGACESACAGTTECKGVPKCGTAMPAGSCTTCTESACCAEQHACAADGTCYLCLENDDEDPGCATNAQRKALATCAAKQCATECADSGLPSGADPGSSDDEETDDAEAAPTTTKVVKTTGCATTGPERAGLGGGAWVAAGLALAGAFARRRSASTRR